MLNQKNLNKINAILDFHKKNENIIDNNTIDISVRIAYRLTANDLKFRLWANGIIFLIHKYCLFLIWGLYLPILIADLLKTIPYIMWICLAVSVIYTAIIIWYHKKIERAGYRSGIWQVALLYKKEVLLCT